MAYSPVTQYVVAGGGRAAEKQKGWPKAIHRCLNPYMSHIKRITTVWSGRPGLPGTTTLYFHENSHTAADQVDAVKAFWNSLKNNIVTGVNLTVDGTVEIVESDTGDIVGTDATGHGGVIVGTDSADPLPPSVQGLIQWRTGVYVGGREIRGRTFIGCLTETSNTNGVPPSGTIAAWTGYATTMLGSALAVYSPTKHQWASVASGNAWGQFAVLRSRRD